MLRNSCLHFRERDRSLLYGNLELKQANAPIFFIIRLVLLLCCLGFLSPQGSVADHLRTQTLALQAGWNAVFFAVDPVESDPDALFSETTVDMVATYDQAISMGQFSSDPSADMLRQLGWGIWYSAHREDSFLTDLSVIHGNKAYLIHASADEILSVEGTVRILETQWKPSAFNLVGFTLDESAPPTFAQFFGASSAHKDQALYRLIDGVWTAVQLPSATPMKNGEAFWVYCNGFSIFEGPLMVETSTSAGVSLREGTEEVVLRNVTAHPVEPTIEHITSGSDYVPMAMVIEVIGESGESLDSIPVSMGDGSWIQNLPMLEAGAATRVPLQLRSDAATKATVKSLLCIKTDLGTETWVPVTGLREDLK